MSSKSKRFISSRVSSNWPEKVRTGSSCSSGHGLFAGGWPSCCRTVETPCRMGAATGIWRCTQRSSRWLSRALTSGKSGSIRESQGISVADQIELRLAAYHKRVIRGPGFVPIRKEGRPGSGLRVMVRRGGVATVGPPVGFDRAMSKGGAFDLAGAVTARSAGRHVACAATIGARIVATSHGRDRRRGRIGDGGGYFSAIDEGRRFWPTREAGWNRAEAARRAVVRVAVAGPGEMRSTVVRDGSRGSSMGWISAPTTAYTAFIPARR